MIVLGLSPSLLGGGILISPPHNLWTSQTPLVRGRSLFILRWPGSHDIINERPLSKELTVRKWVSQWVSNFQEYWAAASQLKNLWIYSSQMGNACGVCKTKSEIKENNYWGTYSFLPRMPRLEWAYCTLHNTCIQ